MKVIHAASFTALLVATSVAAQAEAPYVDDRSSASSLIQSLYNAIERKEYARAWDYFGKKPAKDFDSFMKGYAETESVSVQTGAVSSDGAAGSIYFQVPVAIWSRAKDSEQWFAGCYVVRQVNAAAQEPPFKPLQIDSAKLKKAQGQSLDENLPRSCGDVPAPDLKTATLERAKSVLHGELSRQCDLNAMGEDRLANAEAYEIPFKYSYETPDDPEHRTVLMVFPCNSGAYNTTEIYYAWAQDEGFTQLTFASPELDYQYADENSEKLKSMTLKGFASGATLVNSAYDPETKSISSFSKWRGIGDASSTGTWVFRDGRFVLDEYAVDPTYDGESEATEVIKAGRVVLAN